MRRCLPQTVRSASTPQPTATPIQRMEGQGDIRHSCDVHPVRPKGAATDDLSETMQLRANFGWGLLGGLVLAMSGCATPPTPVQPPPVVATLPPPPPPMRSSPPTPPRCPPPPQDLSLPLPSLGSVCTVCPHFIYRNICSVHFSSSQPSL